MSRRAITKTWRKFECVSVSERSQCEKATYRDMLEETKPWDSEKLSRCSGLGGRKDGQVEHGGFLEQWNHLCDTTMVDPGHYTHLSRLTERTPPSTDPPVHCGIRVTTTRQCRLADCNKWTIWRGRGPWGRHRRSTGNLRTFPPILL